MSETADNFRDRSYWVWDREIVHVYLKKRNLGKCEIWELQKAVQYVNYLEQNERANQQRD